MSKNIVYQFIENTFSLFAIKAIDLGIALWLIPFLIVKVGLINYGIYAFAMALVLFFMNVLNYGFSLATVREIAKNKENPEKINQLFNEVFSVKIVLFSIEYSVFILLIFIFPIFWEFKTLYFFTSFLLIGELFSLRWFFLGMEKMKFEAFINLVKTIIYVLLVLIFVNEKADYIYIPLFEAIGMILITILLFVWVLKKHKIKLQFISIKKVFEYLKLNFSSFINSLLPSTFGNIIVFLVGVFGLPQQVSFMHVGLKITNAFSTVNAILTKVFYPMINRTKEIMFPSRILLLFIGAFLSLLLFFGSDYLILNWLSLEAVEEYQKTIVIVKILSPIPFLMGVISSYGIHGLLSHYKDTLFSIITGFSGLITIILGSFLIPIYPFFGGAITLLLGRVLYAGWSYYSFKNSDK